MLDATFDYSRTVPDIMEAFGRAQGTLESHDLDRNLRHLVMLRASQINGCAFCVKMHTGEARDDGETNDRLDHLVVWRHVDDYLRRGSRRAGLDRGADHPGSRPPTSPPCAPICNATSPPTRSAR